MTSPAATPEDHASEETRSTMTAPPSDHATLQRDREASLARLAWRADWVRLRTIELIGIAGSGHYSSVFSCAELFAALYYRTLRLRPGQPSWPDRDRFLMGKGHAAIGLYPILADLGFYPESWLADYARLGSRFGDHPDMRQIPGIDFSSGSIGHNLSVGVGMAVAARKQHRDYRTIVMLGDGELHEGQVWEAAMAAAKFELGNLVAIIDENQMCLDGTVPEVMPVEPIAEKWRAFGWNVVELDGHNLTEICTVLDELPSGQASRPTCLLAHTRKGAGVSFMDLSLYWHLGFLGELDRADAETEIRRRLSAIEAEHPEVSSQ